MNSVVTLGTFDGVHRGHQAIIRRVVALAKKLKAIPVALTFGMPPRHVQSGRKAEVLLATWPEKAALLQKLGIKKLQRLTFNRKTASTTAEAFFKREIVEKHRAKAMIVGPRVAFGKGRAGRLGLLRRLGKR